MSKQNQSYNSDILNAEGGNTAEKRLWGQVLLTALNDATYQGDQSPLLRERDFADRWFRSGGERFGFVCHMAGLDPAAVRSAYVDGRIDVSQLSAKRQGQANALAD